VSYKFDTLSLHAGQVPDAQYGASQHWKAVSVVLPWPSDRMPCSMPCVIL
jgi:hypothetical protein